MRGHRLTRCAVLVCTLAVACAVMSAAVRAQDAKLLAAERAIQQSLAKSGAEIGVYFKTLDGKDEWSLHRDDAFHAASTMKIPVMIELFHQVQQGKWTLDDAISIKNEFHSIVDGSVYKLSPADDSEAELYKAEGQTRTLRELCELMITV